MNSLKPLRTEEKEEEELTAAVTASLDDDDVFEAQTVDEFSDEFLMQTPRGAS